MLKVIRIIFSLVKKKLKRFLQLKFHDEMLKKTVKALSSTYRRVFTSYVPEKL